MLKRQLISNEEFFSKFKKAHDINSERRDDNQSVNKNTLLNILIKFRFHKNCRNSNFINENDFNQHTFQSFMQNYNSRKKNDMNLNSCLQDFDEQKKKVIINKIFSQIAILKTRMNNSFYEKTIQTHHQIKSQSDEKILKTTNFTSKSFSNNNNQIMFDSTI